MAVRSWEVWNNGVPENVVLVERVETGRDRETRNVTEKETRKYHDEYDIEEWDKESPKSEPGQKTKRATYLNKQSLVTEVWCGVGYLWVLMRLA
jgi:hypothetical protein